jgi:hypothetical protein
VNLETADPVMNLKHTTLHILQKRADLSSRAKTGVSLHCHTLHSREMLDFVPHYAERLPVISYFWRKEHEKWLEREKREMNFHTGFWSPPMPPEKVFDIERSQIGATGLDPIVSVSDHDCIDANLVINKEVSNEIAPISLEWTVPYDYGFFHVGVHNLPPARAEEITAQLLDFTFKEEGRSKETLKALFAMLNELDGLLVVLNHPLWDIELVGDVKHRLLLENFLNEFKADLHALEVNGFRSWSENKAVIEMAEAYGLPTVTGGDRHGCRPNTVINITNRKTFGEFADEVRLDKRSTVVLMPEYRLPLHSRQLESFAEILDTYPEFPEDRKRWFDRVHFDINDGHGLRPLSVHWNLGGPPWLRMAIWLLGALGSPAARPVFSLIRSRKDVIPKSSETINFRIPMIDSMDREFVSDLVSESGR